MLHYAHDFLREKWETNINACITIYSLINGNDDVIYGPVNGVFYRFPFLWMTWYGHQVAWIDGHQAVMCLHYTVVEEVQKHLKLKIGIEILSLLS